MSSPVLSRKQGYSLVTFDIDWIAEKIPNDSPGEDNLQKSIQQSFTTINKADSIHAHHNYNDIMIMTRQITQRKESNGFIGVENIIGNIKAEVTLLEADLLTEEESIQRAYKTIQEKITQHIAKSIRNCTSTQQSPIVIFESETPENHMLN